MLEPSGHSCVCVLELIMTLLKINYAPEVNGVCKALEVGLLLFMMLKCLISFYPFQFLPAPCFIRFNLLPIP